MHDAVRPDRVVLAVVLHDEIMLHDAVRTEVVEDFIDVLDACQHDAVAVDVIPASVIVDPSARRGAVGIEIVPFAVQLLPAGAHHAAFLVEVTLLPVDSDPAVGDLSVGIHVVGIFSVVDQRVLLHPVVLIVIILAVDLSPEVRRTVGGKILELKVDVHAAFDSRDIAGLCPLPHHCLGLGVFPLIGGDPERILGQGVHVQLCLHPVFVGIKNGEVPCVADLFAEGVHDVGDLVLRLQAQRFGIFRVESHRIGDGDVLDQIQDKVRFLLRHFHGSGIRVNIHADVYAGGLGAPHVLPEQRVHLAAVAGAQHDEVDVVCLRGLPVDITLVVGDVHAAAHDAGDRLSFFKELVGA